MIADQHPQPCILHAVGVLKLVHQHMAEAALIVQQYVRVVQPQFMRAQQQLGEIDQPVLVAVVLVDAGRADQLRAGRIVAGIDVLRPPAFILLAVDEPLHFAGDPGGFVEPQAP